MQQAFSVHSKSVKLKHASLDIWPLTWCFIAKLQRIGWCLILLSYSDLCPRCNLERKDLKHLFFDCPLSANIWLQLPAIQGALTASMEEWKEWLHTNVNHSRTNSRGYFLSVLVLVTLRKIWLAKNGKVFDDVIVSSFDICFTSAKFAHEIVKSFTSVACAKPRQIRLIAWNFPGMGKLKLNTDGNPG
ncbi:uncharacterized protein LOC131307180 [Rhododendron vialii]|uniref:uncharacterized protein LOC131307180 n=1 Tax=Rhododendron vialii TaxID=182163 RepID=UPI00265FC7D6|nr:uncharacterized protein LOC131307180 [Rhododendron vialii]